MVWSFETRTTTATVISDKKKKKVVENDCGLQTASFPVLSKFIVRNNHSLESCNFSITSFAVAVSTKCLYKSFTCCRSRVSRIYATRPTTVTVLSQFINDVSFNIYRQKYLYEFSSVPSMTTICLSTISSLLTKQFCLPSCYFHPFRTQYAPPHPVFNTFHVHSSLKKLARTRTGNFAMLLIFNLDGDKILNWIVVGILQVYNNLNFDLYCRSHILDNVLVEHGLNFTWP